MFVISASQDLTEGRLSSETARHGNTLLPERRGDPQKPTDDARSAGEKQERGFASLLQLRFGDSCKPCLK